MTDVTVILDERHAENIIRLMRSLNHVEYLSFERHPDLELLVARIEEGQQTNTLKERLRKIAQK